MNQSHKDSPFTKAASFSFDLDEDDRIVELLGRPNGTYALTKSKIFRIQSPEVMDPTGQLKDVPWGRSLYLPFGSRDWIVARTILQTERILALIFPKNSQEYSGAMEIAWEIMNSLVSLRLILDRLDSEIARIGAEIEADIDAYKTGPTPKTLPCLDFYEIEFRSFANEVRRTLTTISNLFPLLSEIDVGRGHFHKAIEQAKSSRGENSLLFQMLTGDHRWIQVWIAIRVAIEHPTSDKYVELRNFALGPDRQLWLPTWRLVHPELGHTQQQNLLDVFEICIHNLLKLFEDLLLVLGDRHLPSEVKIGFHSIAEDQRDPECPMRYQVGFIA